MATEEAGASAQDEMSGRAVIREVLETYFHGLDARREDLIAACFTDDAVATHHSGSDSEFTLAGAAEIARYFCGLMRTFKASHHAAGSHLIRVDGDTASVETFATAHVVATNDLVRVRGLRYVDALVRVGGRWRIHRRTHIPIWQYDVQAVPPHLPR